MLNKKPEIMELEKLEVYRLSNEISQIIWDEVIKWPHFEKDTIGKQFVRSADSISANISEGYGRFHFRDSKNFLYIARGSLFETKTWLAKSKARNLIDSKVSEEVNLQLIKLSVKLNNFIKVIGKTHLPPTTNNHK
jgi:four helix bundle protein